eukprot:scaffold1187_cov181-Ochromonas_danica.AAC.5
MSYSSRRENHDLLFSNRATNDPTTTRANTTSAPPPLSAPAAGAGAAAAAASTTRPIHDQYGLSEDEGSDPLQLEHVLGYSGLYRHTMMTVPIDDHTFIKSMGSVISIESMNDPQRQQFLRGHDMAISCLAVSPSGQLIASSQEGTMHYKGMAAPIFIWEVQTGRRLMVLRGLVQRTNLIAFSPDEVFLCGCDEDGLLYIYDLTTVCHQDGSILCGGGDGIIVKLQGRDMAWQKIREVGKMVH